MCGIVGYIGNQNAAEIIYDGLTRLEYRGYDSAGIATLLDHKTEIRRAEGKLRHLKAKLQEKPLLGHIGIGHTRWATHGKPSEQNAHPHQWKKITVVHNGIIENYQELRQHLEKKGHHFSSETDTEVVAHLVDEELKESGSTLIAFEKTLQKIRGSYALALLNESEPETFYVARFQSPLVLGIGEKENYCASDIPALLPYTRQIIFLEDGDLAVLSAQKIEIYDADRKHVKRPSKKIEWDLAQAEKGGYKHFMLKEIFEAPRAYIDTLRSRIDSATQKIILPDFEKLLEQYKPELVYLIACGTSYHAALVGKFYLEKFAKIPVVVDVASEFRYRNPILHSKTLLLVISQSGETADTLTVVKNAKKQKAPIYSICNVLESSIPRESNAVFYTHAGPEIGVAATKTFLTQLEALLLIAITWSQHSFPALLKEENGSLIEAILSLSHSIEKILKNYPLIQKIAKEFSKAKLFLFIGRGLLYPIALEGALKLKEISYIFSEGYAAGELKHGPIAMIDQGTPVLALAPRDDHYEKIASNIQEVIARGASVIGIGNEDDPSLREKCSHFIGIPQSDSLLYPLLASIPLQLLAYEIADLNGHDVDQPRNLAKSVTVE